MKPILDFFGRQINLGDLVLYGASGSSFIVVPHKSVIKSPKLFNRSGSGTLMCKGLKSFFSEKEGSGFRKRKKDFPFIIGSANYTGPAGFGPPLEYDNPIYWTYEEADQYKIDALVVVEREFVLNGNKPSGIIKELFELQDEIKQDLHFSTP